VARAKCLAVAPAFPECLVIAADTAVAVDGELLGKPADAADAERMLRLLSGRAHRVLTGVAVAFRDRLLTGCETTRVVFDRMNEQQIAAYIASGEPGTELEFVIMVIAVSCVKLLSAHNSTQHTSRKHKV
jgi:Nucleotide-binding protein implicated in inhibition of septum formation